MVDGIIHTRCALYEISSCADAIRKHFSLVHSFQLSRRHLSPTFYLFPLNTYSIYIVPECFNLLLITERCRICLGHQILKNWNSHSWNVDGDSTPRSIDEYKKKTELGYSDAKEPMRKRECDRKRKQQRERIDIESTLTQNIMKWQKQNYDESKHLKRWRKHQVCLLV